MKLVAALAALLALAATAHAAPSGAHPRIVLDDTLRAAWKREAKDEHSAAHWNLARCDDMRARPEEYKHDGYMGLDWARDTEVCLVAWVATGDQKYADTALLYWRALVDDLDDVGDGKGGDEAARRDSGYAIRSLGSAVALGYDWLHDQLSPQELTRARERFDAWVRWYEANGYRARDPGNNYQAGWLLAATLIAVAEGGEAGDDGDHLWSLVEGTLWGKDMAAALAPGGVLDGGDWPEGWQYGPLSVASYALAARVATSAGIDTAGMPAWLEAELRHAIHGRNPGGGFYAGGDADDELAFLEPPYLAYAAPLIGDATPEVQSWAAAELGARAMTYDQFPFFAALAEAREAKPVPAPLATWPTAYLATSAGNFYARAHWTPSAVWMATTCRRHMEVDHSHPDAGNVVLARGGDGALIDPSPYGTQSTLTSNAPTVDSALYPAEYHPSQAFWSLGTRFGWARQTQSGVVAARCDYRDQYRFQETDPDVELALRDLVMVPYAGGDAAAMVVIDHGKSGASNRAMYLRFYTEAALALDGDVATGTTGKTQVWIRRVSSSSGAPEVRHLERGDCNAADNTGGRCEAARVKADEYRITIDGPDSEAIHVIDAAAPAKGAPDARAIDHGVILTRDGRTTVVVDARGKDLTYTAPAGIHVVVGAPADEAFVSAAKDGDGCKVTVAAAGDGAKVDALPVVVQLDASCAVTEDPSLVEASQSTLASTTRPRSQHGCCGAQASPESPAVLTLVIVFGLVVILRRRARSTAA
jgi:hypothetical protein